MEKVIVRRLTYSPCKAYDEHAHSETQITLIVSGGVEERVNDQWRRIGPLEYVVKPAGLRHTNRFGDKGTQTIQISLSPCVARQVGVVTSLGVYHSKLCPRVTQRFLNVYADAPSALESWLSREMLEGLFRGIDANTPCRVKTPCWLAKLADQVEREYRYSLTLQGLARQYCRHPVSIARAFRARYGLSIKERICQLRVQCAAQQLTETHHSATTISQACGFSDQSHMNRVFKSVTGIPPGRFRRIVYKNRG